jgi:CubicO group peptidase (beta-lactamase class C family)
MLKYWFVLLFIFFINPIAMAQSNDAEKDDSKAAASSIEALDEQMKELLKYHGIPAVSVAIIEDGKTVLVKGIGLANLENNEAATERTLFRIGSISKMFVGLSVLKLVEEGKLDLQTPIKDLIPDIQFTNPYADTHPVRVIHLLQHTTGWDDIHLPEYALNDPTPIMLKDGLDFHPNSRVSRWRPGERMSYANSGSPVAAYIVQTITGTDFEDYVQAHFFEPLNMNQTTYRLPNKTEPQATLYVNKTPQEYWHILMRPSGSINASANDMAKLVEFFVKRGAADGKQILSANSIKIMETPSTTLASKVGLRHGYGFTNYSSFREGFMFNGHNGGVQGGASDLAYSPEHGIGFAIAINKNSAGMNDISNAIVKYLTRNIPKPSLPDAKSLSADAAAKFTGFYMPVNPRQELTRFQDQIMGVRKLTVNPSRALLSGGSQTYSYVPVNNSLLR